LLYQLTPEQQKPALQVFWRLSERTATDECPNGRCEDQQATDVTNVDRSACNSELFAELVFFESFFQFAGLANVRLSTITNKI